MIEMLPENLRKRVALYEPTGCWIWCGGVTVKGYGRVYVGGGRNRRKSAAAHRRVYQLLIGQIPDGLEIDHLCRVRQCCNPSHLEPVTQMENWRRGSAPTMANALKTHCKHGHPLNGDNLMVRKNGHRQCRQCNKDYCKAWRKSESIAARAYR